MKIMLGSWLENRKRSDLGKLVGWLAVRTNSDVWSHWCFLPKASQSHYSQNGRRKPGLEILCKSGYSSPRISACSGKLSCSWKLEQFWCCGTHQWKVAASHCEDVSVWLMLKVAYLSSCNIHWLEQSPWGANSLLVKKFTIL